MAAALKYLQSRPKEELRAIYTSLHGVVPGVIGINDNDRLTRPQLVEMILSVRGIRPRHLAVVHQRTPFAIRDYLRRQAKREGLDHNMNKPWKLSGLEYAILFGHRIAKGLKAQAVNDNARDDEPSAEATREVLAHVFNAGEGESTDETTRQPTFEDAPEAVSEEEPRATTAAE